MDCKLLNASKEINSFLLNFFKNEKKNKPIDNINIGKGFHLKDLKRSVNDMNCNAFVKLVLTRCIHCTRCIRFLNEFGGNYNMGMLGRGKQSEIVYI